MLVMVRVLTTIIFAEDHDVDDDAVDAEDDNDDEDVVCHDVDDVGNDEADDVDDDDD